MNQNQKTLIKARKLIEKFENWTQGSYVKKISNRQCYCMAGAIARAAGISFELLYELKNIYRSEYLEIFTFLDSACKIVSGGLYNRFNHLNDAENYENNFGDEDLRHVHAAVLYCFDVAIELAGVNQNEQ
jgi:hypothetical protein